MPRTATYTTAQQLRNSKDICLLQFFNCDGAGNFHWVKVAQEELHAGNQYIRRQRSLRISFWPVLLICRKIQPPLGTGGKFTRAERGVHREGDRKKKSNDPQDGRSKVRGRGIAQPNPHQKKKTCIDQNNLHPGLPQKRVHTGILSRFGFPEFFHQGRHDVEQVGDHANVGYLEDRRFGILIDGDDHA